MTSASAREARELRENLCRVVRVFRGSLWSPHVKESERSRSRPLSGLARVWAIARTPSVRTEPPSRPLNEATGTMVMLRWTKKFPLLLGKASARR
jgi:hypothetical protein